MDDTSSAPSPSAGEISLINCYSVVYRLVGQDWSVLGGGWSQIHLYRDLADGSHRLIGWAVNTFDVVLNANINHSCRYKMKSDDFHKFTDEEGNVYGFGFYKKEESVKESKLFANTILACIETPIIKSPDVLPGSPVALSGEQLASAHRRSRSFIPPAKPNPQMANIQQHQQRLTVDDNYNTIAKVPSSTAMPDFTPVEEKKDRERGASLSSPASPQATDLNRVQSAAPSGGSSGSSGASSSSPSPAPETASPPPRSGGLSSPDGPLPRRISDSSPHIHHSENKQIEDYYLNHIPMGKMKILPAKPTKTAAPVKPTLVSQPSVGNKTKIKVVTDPLSVEHLSRVTFDPVTRTYKGLPPEWQMALNKQFGLDPAKLEGVKLAHYASRIPVVLVKMKEYLLTHGGAGTEGIFRIAPDASESNAVKQQLNENRFQGCNDIHVISNLIKVFFRELPNHILNGVEQLKIQMCESEDAAGDIVQRMKEPQASYMMWLLDLCCDIASNAGTNKMNSKNLGIVFGPNLFTPDDKDPLQSLLYSQKVAHFLHKAIDWRMTRRPQ